MEGLWRRERAFCVTGDVFGGRGFYGHGRPNAGYRYPGVGKLDLVCWHFWDEFLYQEHQLGGVQRVCNPWSIAGMTDSLYQTFGNVKTAMDQSHASRCPVLLIAYSNPS